MAVIQMRHGAYTDFDPTKMQVAELAVVTSGDPNSSTGKALYVCVAENDVVRIVDYDDATDIMTSIVSDYVSDIQTLVSAIETALPAAQSATTAATNAATSANSAATSANTAAAAATAAIAAIQEPLWVNMSTVSELPVTLNNAKITSDMICSAYVLGTPSAQMGDWTITTANGSVTVSGTISGSTTLMLLLEKVESI